MIPLQRYVILVMSDGEEVEKGYTHFLVDRAVYIHRVRAMTMIMMHYGNIFYL